MYYTYYSRSGLFMNENLEYFEIKNALLENVRDLIKRKRNLVERKKEQKMFLDRLNIRMIENDIRDLTVIEKELFDLGALDSEFFEIKSETFDFLNDVCFCLGNDKDIDFLTTMINKPISNSIINYKSKLNDVYNKVNKLAEKNQLNKFDVILRNEIG